MVITDILFDKDGNFLWASVAALVAFIAAVISIVNAVLTIRSNFKGNVTKARIEWIQEVRKKSADFIAACYDLFEFLELQSVDKIDSDSKKEIARLKNEVQKNGTLLILYFGPDSSKNNDFVVMIIEDLVKILTSRNLWMFRKVIPINTNHLDVLRDFLRLYFKAEWKRANGVLKNSKKVQAYLEKDKAYEKMLEIFKDRLEEYEQKNLDNYERTKINYEVLKDRQDD
ncbi:Uncharacterised protein [Lysinibacillus capsici]|uniref:Uncharacterized protein n=1 Tax=Lysinibacillus capsici TaxID=2115968 RepID=A0A2X0XLM3_9BACI|nr:hypothetical protein [Lysinibacillus capsici]SPT98786.1 Uncharacterised protein [Lysinibacillus capsici]